MKPHFFVPQQVPEFIRAEYPAFVEFLRAYYQWLEEEYSLGKFEDLVDIDNTVDGFIEYFRRQLDVAGITVNQTNPLYLKHVKELYAAKGSNASYEFLFKLLFNTQSTTFAPWDRVLIPSNGQWVQEVSLLTTITVGHDANLIGNQITITDESGREYKTFVTNTNDRGDGTVEVFIKRITPYDVLTSFTSAMGVEGVILNTTTRAVVERKGSGFDVGQVFDVTTYGGTGTLIKVKTVDATGGITAVDIIRFGTGYSTDFNIMITPTNALSASAITAYIKLGNLTYQTNDIANPQNESGSIVSHSYTDLGSTYFTDPTYVGRTVATLHSDDNARISPNVEYASIKFTVAQQCVYPGAYASGSSILDDDSYIQDSDYYQVYSYVTVVEEALSKYSTVLKNTLHPTGTKHFANYTITNVFQLTVDTTSSFNLISKDDAIRDIVAAVEQMIFDVSTVLTDVAIPTDQFDRVVSYFRDFVDSATVSDTKQLDVTKPLIETVAAADLFDRTVSFVRIYTDSAATSEIQAFDVTKPLTPETATVSDSQTLVADYIRSYTDTTTNTDAYSLTTTKPVTESLVTADSYTQQVDFIRSFADGGATADSYTLSVAKSTADSLLASDVFQSTTSFLRDYTDTVTIGDNSTITLTLNPTEFLTAVDQSTFVASFIRSFNDLAAATDAPSLSVETSFNEAIAISDAFISATSFVRSYADDVTALDEINVGYGTTPSDSITTSDAFVTVTQFDRSFVELAITTDTTSFTATKPVNDSVINSDVTTIINTFIRNFNEALTTSDVITLISTVYTGLFDSFTTADSISLQIAPKPFAETTLATDITSVTPDKYNGDTVNTATGFGGLYMDPLYVVQETPYWYPDYLENERVISN